MDHNLMTQLLPPSNRLKKSKDRSSIAIILAVSIHVLVAVVIYFTVFNDKKSSTEEPLLNNNGLISASVIEENELTPLDSEKDMATQSSDLQKEGTNTADINMTANTEKNLADKNVVTTQKTKSIVQNEGQKDSSASIEQASRLNANNNLKPNTDLVLDTQQEPPEYTLKQTKEYQQLDADIDKDADQLSKLIGEVKKYNQSQIQQYQTDTPSNKSATATPSVKYDYPITPITSPPSSSANKNQTIPESSESDR